MRLIELKAAKKKIRDESYELITEDGGEGMYTDDIIDALDRVPVVDAVPVVRCKGCRWAYDCNGHRHCNFFAGDIMDDWYCSHGMRKENEIVQNES